ncbi:TonB family protein [Marinicella gelatinilytica]|uniref:TonB family protein n=1 Tax=Marinicella gelatinilytica TaxID=2996017 RepID=UPI002260DC3A|nr:TonB family protein [Marinicella gelatinilytica]MCX7544562.1 TonB family protein [Marinicella gelatinilytica]
MKKLSVFIMLALTSVACADFLDAAEAYEQQDYPTALQEYQALAQLGHHEAQHNLAVMHFLGQGTEKNPIQAYAWATLALASKDTKLHALEGKIKDKLTTQQLTEAQQQAQILQQQYGTDAINQLWAPVMVKSEESEAYQDGQSLDFTLTPVKRKAPRYPKNAMRKGIQGWVKVTFEVHPDGTARKPVIADSFPEGVFEEATLKAIRGFRFDVDFKPGVDPYPVSATQSITYEMRNTEKFQESYQQRLDELRSLANQGHPDAYYYLAMALDEKSPIPQASDEDIDQTVINQYLFKAAQSGQINAQFHLGNNLFTGKSGYQNRSKGLRWLIMAAEQGQAQAARRLALIFESNPDMNPTEHPPHYWMAQAANQGDLDAKLDYAEWLADNAQSQEQYRQGLELLEDYADERPETVLWYQTKAQLHEQTGDTKKAQKYHKKAEKLAKRLGWED